jgi:hypothetical protein
MRIDFDGTTVRFYLYGGYPSTYSGGLGWSGTVNGVGVGGSTAWPTGTHGAPGILFGAWTANYGSQTVSFTLNYTGTSAFGGPTTHSVSIYRPYPATVPAAPTPVSIDQVTTTSLRFKFSGNSDGGSPITSWQAQIASDSAFTQNVQTVTSDGTTVFTGRTPNQPQWTRARGNNAVGSGPWSSALTATTLPATAPGLSVTPALSGQSATVNLTPPGGATGVTEYNIEYRLLGSGAATALTSTTTTKDVPGLTPGATYEWRANAEFGASYTSPWSDWVAYIQPNPNTSPGDYFDGSTAARPDLTFAWTGTVNNSTSLANGVGVDGWAVANGAGGGALRLQRVTGGRSGQYAARMLVINDLPAVGAFLGMNFGDVTERSEVEPDTLYVGSIYARPSRAQRLAVEIVWVNAAGLEVGVRAQSTPIVVSDLVGWTRLSVSGVSPTTAVTAVVRVKDATGTGFVTWKSGEWLDADDAMVSLGVLFPWFSGDTPDTPGIDNQWLGTPNASVSAQYTVPVAASNPLADPDCPAPPAPPSLPTIPSECIDETGTWRQYAISIPAGEVRLWSSALPTLILSTAANAERQVRIRYFPNPTDDAAAALGGAWEAEQILTYVPPNADIRLDGVTELVTAVVNGGASLPADELLYGTAGTPASWPELRCGIGYVVTMDVPLEAPAGNLSARIIITQRM